LQGLQPASSGGGGGGVCRGGEVDNDTHSSPYATEKEHDGYNCLMKHTKQSKKQVSDDA
jgi:hypothetical protein